MFDVPSEFVDIKQFDHFNLQSICFELIFQINLVISTLNFVRLDMKSSTSSLHRFRYEVSSFHFKNLMLAHPCA